MTETINYNTSNLIAGQILTEQVALAADTYYQGMLLEVTAPVTVTPGANTGDGTVTLASGTDEAVTGSYTLTCVDGAGGDAKTIGAAVADPGNTGNGTVTIPALVGTSAKVGNYVLACIAVRGTPASIAGAVADPGNTGNGTIAAPTYGTATKAGAYILTCIDATVLGSEIFSVTDPDGVRLQDATVGVAYNNAHIAFTITAGGIGFAVADFFTVTVVMQHGGLFELTDPDNNTISDNILLPGTPGGTVAVTGGGISFTLTDGAVDFASGDFFSIPVSGSHGGVFRLVDPNGWVLDRGITLPGTPGGTVVYADGQVEFTLTDGATDFITGDSFTLAVGSAQTYRAITNRNLRAIYNDQNARVLAAPGYGYAIVSGTVFEGGLRTDLNAEITLTPAQRLAYQKQGFFVKPR